MFVLKIVAALILTVVSVLMAFGAIELLTAQNWVPGILVSVVTLGGFNSAYRLAQG